MDDDVIGVLYKRSPQVSIERQVRLAILCWQAAPHTDGRYPDEVHFNPAEVPDELEIEGLYVLPDDEVRPGYIRLTTLTLSAEAELAINRAIAAAQVERQVQAATAESPVESTAENQIAARCQLVRCE